MVKNVYIGVWKYPDALFFLIYKCVVDMKIICKKLDYNYIKENEQQLLEKVDSDRRAKVERISAEKERYRCLGAGLLLADVIDKELGIHTSNIKLSYGENGKPSLVGYEEFNYNLSHSGDMVVIAYGNAPVGIDIEYLERRNRYNEAVIKRCFTESEQKYAISNGDKGFFDIWTMKEAYLKLSGKGVSVPLNSFSVDPVGEMCSDKEVAMRLFHCEDYVVAVSIYKCDEQDIDMIFT